MRDKAYVGENGFGAYYLYQVKDEAGTEYSFFAPVDVHQKILESGIKAGDQFRLSKVAVQNGKKVSSRFDFEVVSKATAAAMPAPRMISHAASPRTIFISSWNCRCVMQSRPRRQ